MTSIVLTFLFGSGWIIAWHLLLWLALPLFVVMPAKMLIEDAFKTPPPTATLGTFGMLIMPATYFATACLGTAFIIAVAGEPSWARTG